MCSFACKFLVIAIEIVTTLLTNVINNICTIGAYLIADRTYVRIILKCMITGELFITVSTETVSVFIIAFSQFLIARCAYVLIIRFLVRAIDDFSTTIAVVVFFLYSSVIANEFFGTFITVSVRITIVTPERYPYIAIIANVVPILII